MLPLSFAEYLELSGLDKHTSWKNYFQNGGFPYAVQIEDDTIRHDYLDGIYHTVLIKDIAARKRINDMGLLESVVKFMFDNIGNNVYIGKVGDLEVDFVAERNGETEYYQVAATVMSDDTFDREITPLKRIRDNYPKNIITMDELQMDEEGIKIINVTDFLLK